MSLSCVDLYTQGNEQRKRRPLLKIKPSHSLRGHRVLPQPIPALRQCIKGLYFRSSKYPKGSGAHESLLRLTRANDSPLERNSL